MHIHFGMSGAFKTMTLPGPETTETTRLTLENKDHDIIAHLSAMTVILGDLGAHTSVLLKQDRHARETCLTAARGGPLGIAQTYAAYTELDAHLSESALLCARHLHEIANCWCHPHALYRTFAL